MNGINIDKLYKEFKKEHPETIGETDKCFDQDNYKDWLEIQVMKLRDTKQVNDANTSKEECTLHNVSRCAFYVEIEAVGSIIVIAENKEEVDAKIKKEGITSPYTIKIAMGFIA